MIACALIAALNLKQSSQNKQQTQRAALCLDRKVDR